MMFTVPSQAIIISQAMIQFVTTYLTPFPTLHPTKNNARLLSRIRKPTSLKLNESYDPDYSFEEVSQQDRKANAPTSLLSFFRGQSPLLQEGG